ncbi:hypothetical protein M422DRAFT_243921 [Sphaerobolus stellatus SS14]|nr:hypothetical protein M422DRAFT_243921 [Sphaerobolus stellatus SS14]
MPSHLVRKVTFWKKKSASNSQSCDIGGDWINDPLKVARLTMVAGEAMPAVGGLIKGAAGLVNVLAIRVQIGISTRGTIVAANNEEARGRSGNEVGLDDYYQIKPADIDLMQTLVSSRDAVQENLATVYCGGTNISAMVRMYKGRKGKRSLDTLAGFYYLVNTIPCFSKISRGFGGRGSIPIKRARFMDDDPNSPDYPLILSGQHPCDYFGVTNPAQIDRCEYQSVDKRSVVAIAITKTADSEAVIQLNSLFIPEFPESSFGEKLLRQIEHLQSINHSDKREITSMLHAFHSFIPLESTIWRAKNIFLVTVRRCIMNPPDRPVEPPKIRGAFNPSARLIAQFKKGIAATYSGWQYSRGYPVDKIYRTQLTAKGIKIWKVDTESVLAPVLGVIGGVLPSTMGTLVRMAHFADVPNLDHISFTFVIKIRRPGNNSDISPFLFAQINALATKSEEVCLHKSYRDGFEFDLYPITDRSGCIHDPRVYWSTCPSGATTFTALEAYSFGIKYLPIVENIVYITRYVYHPERDVLKHMYESCGLNPESDDVSKFMGFPVPDLKEFDFPKPHRRLSYFQSETMKRPKAHSKPYSYFQLPDPTRVSKRYMSFDTVA